MTRHFCDLCGEPAVSREDYDKVQLDGREFLVGIGTGKGPTPDLCPEHACAILALQIEKLSGARVTLEKS